MSSGAPARPVHSFGDSRVTGRSSASTSVSPARTRKLTFARTASVKPASTARSSSTGTGAILRVAPAASESMRKVVGSRNGGVARICTETSTASIGAVSAISPTDGTAF